jgi:lipopolysaccharide/colanic/teichoic acid biosynthesis glycosyltransferase
MGRTCIDADAGHRQDARIDHRTRPIPWSRRPVAHAAKRGLDVVGAATGLVVLAPVLAWSALGVAVTLGRPILFRQQRPGLHGEPFEILKFRTMRPPRAGEVWFMTDEERLTRLGRFMRVSSIDELPALWNVLKGDMSLVGPRPLLMDYLDTYTPEQRRRQDMPPGITGWATVNGRNALCFKDRLRLDTWYVDHWTPWLDLRILARTAGQVLRRCDASACEDNEALGFPLPGVGASRQPDGTEEALDEPITEAAIRPDQPVPAP